MTIENAININANKKDPIANLYHFMIVVMVPIFFW